MPLKLHKQRYPVTIPGAIVNVTPAGASYPHYKMSDELHEVECVTCSWGGHERELSDNNCPNCSVSGTVQDISYEVDDGVLYTVHQVALKDIIIPLNMGERINGNILNHIPTTDYPANYEILNLQVHEVSASTEGKLDIHENGDFEYEPMSASWFGADRIAIRASHNGEDVHYALIFAVRVGEEIANELSALQ